MTGPHPSAGSVCRCGHRIAEHASSRGHSLRGVPAGVCLAGGCTCPQYAPKDPPIGPRPRAYLDRDHHDRARDEQAENPMPSGPPPDFAIPEKDPNP